MNEIRGMELVYRTLVPVPDYENYVMSIGTVTFAMPEELSLDFSLTEGSQYPNEDGTITVRVSIKDFDARIYEEQYEEFGVKDKLTYSFFRSRLKETCLTEVYTEYVNRHEETFLPVTLESAVLAFSNGKCLDYSKRISAAALMEMAEVA